MQNMGLADEDDVYVQEDAATLPTVSVAKEKILEDLKRQEREEGYKPTLSMVVVGTCRLLLVSLRQLEALLMLKVWAPSGRTR